MGKYIGPSCKICRKVSSKLFLKGERCFTPKCAIEKQRPIPGASQLRRRRLTDYGIHLREKQKLRFSYGLMEKQFRAYMTNAFKSPGITGVNLLRTLERRFDNVIYLLGFADSRKQARQMVNHGHYLVNGIKTDIPSYLVKSGDTIAWRESLKNSDYYKERTDGLPKRQVPSWITLNQQDMTGTVESLPPDEELQQSIDSRLIVEFYSS